MATVELYGQNCDTPLLPQPLDDHVSFLTKSGHLATCGGINQESFAFNNKCWVLNSENLKWENGIIGSLIENRVGSSVASLLHGVYVLGGDGSFLSGKSSEFLAAGGVEWEAGPEAPNTLVHHCTVTITDASFLVIGGQFQPTAVLEYESNMKDPINSKGWKNMDKWDSLVTGRLYHGCAKRLQAK